MWRIPVFLNIKSFIWLLLQERLSFRDRVWGLGSSPLLLTFAHSAGLMRKISHTLFSQCSSISSMWYLVASMWNLIFVCTPDIKFLFDSWIYYDLLLQQLQPWPLVLSALGWFIWTCCNRVIFRQEAFNSTSCIELFRYHFIWWSKIAWGSVVPSVTNIYRNPDEVSVPPPHCLILRTS